MAKREERKSYALMLPVEMMTRLKEVARAEDRSVSSLVRTILKKAVQGYDEAGV